MARRRSTEADGSLTLGRGRPPGALAHRRQKAAPDEVRALTRLAFTEIGRAVGGIAGVHRAVADRAFTASGPAAQPARVVHDAISEGVYAAVRGAAELSGRGAALLGGAGVLAPSGRSPARAAGAPEPLSAVRRAAPSETPRGAVALAVINGLIGDQLEREESDLRQPMAVRVGGRAIAPERDALAAAFPAATPRLVVFLHGLMETEFAWRLGGDEPYAPRLARDLGVTPIEVRYNTGRHISENGRSLADLMARLVDAWPLEVERIALVGHSMGGLVARSACHLAREDRVRKGDGSRSIAPGEDAGGVRRAPGPPSPGEDAGGVRRAPGPPSPGEDAAWVGRVRHVVSLGSPHLGAPLAQGVHVVNAALDALPETRPFGGLLRRRSAGIRDLRHGSLVDDDWRDQDPDALRARACAEVPLLDGATHCFVTATITASPRHPLGRLIGDALVLSSSASGRGRSRRIPFRDEDGMHLGGTHHLALLNHSAVYEQLHDWLSADPVRPST